MKLKTKIRLIFLLITFCTSKGYCQTTKSVSHKKTAKNKSVKSNISCSDLKVREYYYNEENTFKNGSVKLFSYNNGKRFDELNKLILKNSEYLLNRYSEKGDLSFHRETDSIFNYYQDNKKFQDWVNHLDLSKIFTLDSESDSYQKRHEELSSESEEYISSELLYLDGIMVYNVSLSYKFSKDPSQQEYLNIDLNKMKLIDFKSLITVEKKDVFNKNILNYSENHKKEIVKNYTERKSEGAGGDLLYSYMLVFAQPYYDSNKIKCKIDSNEFSHFSAEGIVFNVNVTDENFLLDKENPRIEEYVSEITIPYKEIINYLDKNNSLYSSINKQITSEIKN